MYRTIIDCEALESQLSPILPFQFLPLFLSSFIISFPSLNSAQDQVCWGHKGHFHFASTLGPLRLSLLVFQGPLEIGMELGSIVFSVHTPDLQALPLPPLVLTLFIFIFEFLPESFYLHIFLYIRNLFIVPGFSSSLT